MASKTRPVVGGARPRGLVKPPRLPQRSKIPIFGGVARTVGPLWPN